MILQVIAKVPVTSVQVWFCFQFHYVRTLYMVNAHLTGELALSGLNLNNVKSFCLTIISFLFPYTLLWFEVARRKPNVQRFTIPELRDFFIILSPSN